jgi:transposase
VRAKLALSERTYECQACGVVLDRGVNAAVNLQRLAGSGPDSIGRGADQKTPLAGQLAVKRQPGRVTIRQTGTLPLQGEGAA